jgi:hypothetical protein
MVAERQVVNDDLSDDVMFLMDFEMTQRGASRRPEREADHARALDRALAQPQWNVWKMFRWAWLVSRPMAQ